MDVIEFRLVRIENQLRFQRRIIAFLIILLLAGISYGATAPIPAVIRARKFEVVNPEGREVVVLESWKFGGIIETFPAKGRYWPSVTLGHSDNGDTKAQITVSPAFHRFPGRFFLPMVINDLHQTEDLECREFQFNVILGSDL